MGKRRLFTRKKDRPGSMEKTLAALISRATTRVNVELQIDNGGVLGLYTPEEDRIFLFKVGDAPIPPECVALEEAGHSLQRDEYLQSWDRFGSLKKRLEEYHQRATAVLDWLEDARVYRALKEDYPGAAADLDFVWEARDESLQNLGFEMRDYPPDTAELLERAHRVVNKLLEIVGRYADTEKEKAEPLPRSFEHVLDEVERWLEVTTQRPKQSGEKGGEKPLLVSGREGDQRKQVTMSNLKMVKPEMEKEVEVSISIAGDPEHIGGLDLTQVEYPWRILSQDVLDVGGGDLW